MIPLALFHFHFCLLSAMLDPTRGAFVACRTRRLLHARLYRYTNRDHQQAEMAVKNRIIGSGHRQYVDFERRKQEELAALFKFGGEKKRLVGIFILLPHFISIDGYLPSSHSLVHQLLFNANPQDVTVHRCLFCLLDSHEYHVICFIR